MAPSWSYELIDSKSYEFQKIYGFWFPKLFFYCPLCPLKTNTGVYWNALHSYLLIDLRAYMVVIICIQWGFITNFAELRFFKFTLKLDMFVWFVIFFIILQAFFDKEAEKEKDICRDSVCLNEDSEKGVFYNKFHQEYLPIF